MSLAGEPSSSAWPHPGRLTLIVYLQPGEWGRFAGQPVLKSGVEQLKRMGITSIRLGGSFASQPYKYADGFGDYGDPDTYFWQRWIGKPWARPSLGAEWGAELLSGFGPFEFIGARC